MNTLNLALLIMTLSLANYSVLTSKLNNLELRELKSGRPLEISIAQLPKIDFLVNLEKMEAMKDKISEFTRQLAEITLRLSDITDHRVKTNKTSIKNNAINTKIPVHHKIIITPYNQTLYNNNTGNFDWVAYAEELENSTNIGISITDRIKQQKREKIKKSIRDHVFYKFINQSGVKSPYLALINKELVSKKRALPSNYTKNLTFSNQHLIIKQNLFNENLKNLTLNIQNKNNKEKLLESMFNDYFDSKDFKSSLTRYFLRKKSDIKLKIKPIVERINSKDIPVHVNNAYNKYKSKEKNGLYNTKAQIMPEINKSIKAEVHKQIKKHIIKILGTQISPPPRLKNKTQKGNQILNIDNFKQEFKPLTQHVVKSADDIMKRLNKDISERNKVLSDGILKPRLSKRRSD